MNPMGKGANVSQCPPTEVGVKGASSKLGTLVTGNQGNPPAFPAFPWPTSGNSANTPSSAAINESVFRYKERF